MGAGGSVHDIQKLEGQKPNEFVVSIAAAERFKLVNQLPSKFYLQINYESLDFVNLDDKTPIIQFPFQNIISWGHNQSIFRFNLFDYEMVGNDDITIILKTYQGYYIETMTMNTVRNLMADMEKKAISKDEFTSLIPLIIDTDTGQLKENWLKTISHYSTGRTFLAKQCMDLITYISPLAPFEKYDLACLLYTRILNKDSFQLVVNSFEDEIERNNLIYRLGLDKNNLYSRSINVKNKDSSVKKVGLVSDCKILPMAPLIRNTIQETTQRSSEKSIDDSTLTHSQPTTTTTTTITTTATTTMTTAINNTNDTIDNISDTTTTATTTININEEANKKQNEYKNE